MSQSSPQQEGSNHEHFLQEFDDFEEDDTEAFDVIRAESELPEVTSLGLHEIQESFQTLLHGLEEEDEEVQADDGAEGSSRGERGLRPKLTKAQARAIKARQERAKQVAKANKAAAKAANKAKKGDKKANKAAKQVKKNKGKRVKAPTQAPTPTGNLPTPTGGAPHSAPARTPTGTRRRLKLRKYL